jgi:HD superfamily phosphohydrolase
MASSHKTYEIRCPVHGFILINDWEREIINHPAFQRLRRIRQLAWTDQVYPGAMHTRFEHSLGVMHVATNLYRSIVSRSKDQLRSEFSYEDVGLQKHEGLVRLAALLHDVGHAPFSHAAEDLFPLKDGGGKRFKHEDYSAAIIRSRLRDVIENHPFNRSNYQIKADDVADLIEGKPSAGIALMWGHLISGQIDADRMDYLIRDSLHAGVDYGKFDWRRLVNTVELVTGADDRGPGLGVSEGGYHAAEALVLARYFMFTQVYFHRTRVAYNVHLKNALTDLLPHGVFPQPQGEDLEKYMRWDDWRVLGLLAEGKGGEHGRRLAERDHYREICHTSDSPSVLEIKQLRRIQERLGNLVDAVQSAETSTYKLGLTDIPVVSDNPVRSVQPLSKISTVVRGLRPVGKVSLFCSKERAGEARERIRAMRGAKKK